MLFFAEKLLKDDYSTLPDVDSVFAKQFGMTAKEVKDICRQFEFGKLIEWGEESSEIENEYGQMVSELSYDVLRVNREGLKKEIILIKQRYGLRDVPFAPREAILSIAKRIEETLGKDDWLNVVSIFTKGSGAFYFIHEGEYTLTDFLFRHAYVKTGIEPFHVILSEFLNPIHYNLNNLGKKEELFEYIDLIISKNSSKEDYENWSKDVIKYTSAKTEVSTFYNNAYYIVKDPSTGGYFFEGNVVYIRNKKAQYIVIFDVVYSLVPNGGKFEYKTVIDICKKRKVKIDKKSIFRALSGKDALLFKYVKEFEQEPSFGIKLFVPMQDGKHMEFNNKK